MQPNSYSNDPNYTQPNETNPPTPPYQQGGQYVQPPYQGQQGGPYTPPPYQGQQGQPVPPYQYTNQPPPVQQSSAMREGESRKYAIGKIIDFIRWIIVALELLFLLHSFFIISPASFFTHSSVLCQIPRLALRVHSSIGQH